MTSHFDRYHSMKPAFPNIDNYNKFFEDKQKKINKDKLLEEASLVCAWGRPDNESRGYSHSEFISLIRRLADYIRNNT